MGIISNIVKDVGTHANECGTEICHTVSSCCSGAIQETNLVHRVANNMKYNVSTGSHGCPIINECKNIHQGIA